MKRKKLNYETANKLVGEYIEAVEHASKRYNGNDTLNYAYMCGAYISLLKQLSITDDVGSTLVLETQFRKSPLSH
jgi:hypothetical protein